MNNTVRHCFVYVVLAGTLIFTFILTGAYYVLLLVICMIALALMSLFSMLLLTKKIHFELMQYKQDRVMVYHALGFPFGRIEVEIKIRNIFFMHEAKMHKTFLVGGKEVVIPLDNNFEMGKNVLEISSCRIVDMLGIFSKKLKIHEEMELFIEPKIDLLGGYEVDQMGKKLKDWKKQRAEDYDLREYRYGDSMKDIHYKASFKQTKFIVKDRLSDQYEKIRVFIDLSEDAESCRRVFENLYVFLLALSSKQGACLVLWNSKHQLMEEEIVHFEDFDGIVKKILSYPKAISTHHPVCDWMISNESIWGGE